MAVRLPEWAVSKKEVDRKYREFNALKALELALKALSDHAGIYGCKDCREAIFRIEELGK